MPQRNQLFDTDAVKRSIESHHGTQGLLVDLVDGTHVRFRIRRQEGNAYYGVADDGKSVVMNIDTGQFDIGD